MLIKKIQELFQKADQAAFKYVEMISTRPEYQKLIDFISSLEEKQQKIVGQGITLGIIFLPLFAILIFNFSNSSLRSDVAIYKEIGEQIQHFNYKNTELTSLGMGSLGNAPINGQDDLNGRIKTILASKSVPAEKVSIVLFDEVGSTKHLKNIEASLRFQEFTMSDLNIFLNGLTQNEKFKILEFQIDKNTSSARLIGVLRVLHMAKEQGGNF